MRETANESVGGGDGRGGGKGGECRRKVDEEGKTYVRAGDSRGHGWNSWTMSHINNTESSHEKMMNVVQGKKEQNDECCARERNNRMQVITEIWMKTKNKYNERENGRKLDEWEI